MFLVWKSWNFLKDFRSNKKQKTKKPFISSAYDN